MMRRLLTSLVWARCAKPVGHLSEPLGETFAAPWQQGATLPIVLVLLTLLQVLALAQADTAWLALRTAGARRDRLLAYVTADAGLVLCTRLLARAALPVLAWRATGEPAAWRLPQSFAGPAPTASSLAGNWPGAAPQCLVESRPAQLALGQTPASIYLLTVRGLGVRAGLDHGMGTGADSYPDPYLDTQQYLQRLYRLQDGDTEGRARLEAQAWRSVAAVPH